MQIVIDINEETYHEIIDGIVYSSANHDIPQESINAIRKGIPLPKGHGDLIDLNKLDEEMYHNAFGVDSDLQKWDSGCWIRYKLYENVRDKAKIIIKADKALDDMAAEYAEENYYRHLEEVAGRK